MPDPFSCVPSKSPPGPRRPPLGRGELVQPLERQHPVLEIELVVPQTFIRIFEFTTLVVDWIATPMFLGGIKRRLDSAATRQPEYVQVSEVMVPPLQLSLAPGAAAEGAVTEHPAIRFDMELGPVMGTDLLGSDIQARLPSCGNSTDPAEGDEQQGLDAAVPLRLTAAYSLRSSIVS